MDHLVLDKLILGEASVYASLVYNTFLVLALHAKLKKKKSDHFVFIYIAWCLLIISVVPLDHKYFEHKIAFFFFVSQPIAQ